MIGTLGRGGVIREVLCLPEGIVDGGSNKLAEKLSL